MKRFINFVWNNKCTILLYSIPVIMALVIIFQGV